MRNNKKYLLDVLLTLSLIRRIYSSGFAFLLAASLLLLIPGLNAQQAKQQLTPQQIEALAKASKLNKKFIQLQQAGKLTKALRWLRQVLAIREQILGSENLETIDSLNNMGLLQMEIGNRKQAKLYLDRALLNTEKVFGAQHYNTAICLNSIGLLLRDMGMLKQAKHYLERALMIFEKEFGSKHLQTSIILSNLGTLLMGMGDLKQAKHYLGRALLISQQTLDPQDTKIAINLTNMGALLKDMGDLKQAKRYLQRALLIFENKVGSKHPLTAHSLNNLGLIQRDIGNRELAKSYLDRALLISEESFGPYHYKTAITLGNLGMLLLDMGDLQQAKAYLERALLINEKIFGAQHTNIAISLHNLGVLQQALGNFKQAKRYLERALVISENLPGSQHINTATILNDLGQLLQNIGDFKQAKLNIERALLIYETQLGSQHSYFATSLNSLGMLLRNMGDLKQAKPYLQRALAIDEKLLSTQHSRTAKSMMNLGVLLNEMGNYNAAKSYLKRAVEINENVNGLQHADTAISYNNFGMLLKDMGNLKQARYYFESALMIYEKVFDSQHTIIAGSHRNLGVLYWALADVELAMKNFKRADDIDEYLIVNNINLGGEYQKQAFLRQQIGSTDMTISFHLAATTKNINTAKLAIQTILRHKGRVLGASLEEFHSLKKHLTPKLKKLLDKRAELRAYWGYLLLHPAKNQHALVRLATLKKKIHAIESQMSASSSEFNITITPITVENVQNKIPKDTALIELFVYQPFDPKAATLALQWGQAQYIAYVLHNTGAPRWVKLGLAKSIDTAAKKFRDALASRSPKVLINARELDALTMAKIRPLLGETTSLLISPDGQLNLIPFAALVDEHEKFLIERYQFSYLSSGRDLLRVVTTTANNNKPVLLGNADYGGSVGKAIAARNTTRSALNELDVQPLAPLPGAEKEVAAIAKLFQLPKSKILIGKTATEAAIKALEGPAILHLATHGFFLPDVADEKPQGMTMTRTGVSQQRKDPLLRSGLALAGFNNRNTAVDANDGVLTALEVADLDLWGTEVVVLSACETALGDIKVGQGVYGLRRALVLAGAQSQMMTLWNVDDTQTKELMVSWYAQLKKGVGRAEALRKAQLAFVQADSLPVTHRIVRGTGKRQNSQITDPRIVGSKHPNSWASFILSGATGPVNYLKNRP